MQAFCLRTYTQSRFFSFFCFLSLSFFIFFLFYNLCPFLCFKICLQLVSFFIFLFFYNLCPFLFSVSIEETLKKVRWHVLSSKTIFQSSKIGEVAVKMSLFRSLQAFGFQHFLKLFLFCVKKISTLFMLLYLEMLGDARLYLSLFSHIISLYDVKIDFYSALPSKKGRNYKNISIKVIKILCIIICSY